MNVFHPRPTSMARLAALVGAFAGLSAAATLPTAASIATEMGLGWNLGNTMESPGAPPYWSGIAPSQAQIDVVKAAGFHSVRIPCGWYSHTQSDSLTIQPAWLTLVKSVVDYCIKDSLFVILNSHWDNGWLEEHIDASHQALVNKRQGAYWRQIATTFKDYDRHLIFASANEPAVQDAYGTAFGADRVAILNSYHQTFIDTVRATGGNNATRTLVIQGPHADIELTKSAYTTLPTDKSTSGRLMFEDHFYPYQYTLMTSDQSWGNMFYYWGQGNHSTTDVAHNPTWGEEAFVDSEFTILKRMFVDKGMPVVLGEFGAGLRTTLTGADLALHKKGRLAFYKYVAQSGKAHGVIPFAWDTDYKGDMNFTIIDRDNLKVYDQDLMNALLSGAGTTGIESRPDFASGRLSIRSEPGALLASFAAASEGPANVVLTDLRGRTLWSGAFQAQEGQNQFRVPVAQHGLAVVRVRQGEQSEVASVSVP
jgi:hypothetical protein